MTKKNFHRRVFCLRIGSTTGRKNRLIFSNDTQQLLKQEFIQSVARQCNARHVASYFAQFRIQNIDLFAYVLAIFKRERRIKSRRDRRAAISGEVARMYTVIE